MIWMDYVIEQVGDNFRIRGDWPEEVMGKGEDGSPKESMLYKPGDVFVVNKDGWLVKSSELELFLNSKKTSS
jgi:hypothetical protein